MNQLYERIRVLCEEKNITIGELSRRAKLNDDDRQALKRGRRMNISLAPPRTLPVYWASPSILWLNTRLLTC